MQLVSLVKEQMIEAKEHAEIACQRAAGGRQSVACEIEL
jgi:hypothetical protein